MLKFVISTLFILFGMNTYALAETQFYAPNPNSVNATKGNTSKPASVIETNKTRSTPCEPLPWGANTEFESLGFKVRNIWFKSQLWKNENGEVIQDREYIVIHVLPAAELQINETEPDDGSDSWPPKLVITLMQGNSTISYSQGLAYNPNSSDWQRNLWFFSRARLLPSMKVGKDLFFIIDVPPGLQNYTFAAQTRNYKRTFFYVKRQQSNVPEIANNYSDISKRNNCSTYSEPHSFGKVLSSKDIQVQAIDFVNAANIPILLASFEINTSIEPDYHFVAIRFLFRNIGNSTNSPLLESSSGFGSTGSFATAIIGNSGKMYGGQFLEPNVENLSLFPYGSFITTIIYKIPNNEKIASMEICFDCGYDDYLPLDDWRSRSNLRSGQENYGYSKLNLHYISLDNSAKAEKPELSNSRNATEFVSPMVGKIGQTLSTSSYNLIVNELLEGNDALKLYCDSRVDRSCAEFNMMNKQINYFEKRNKVSFTLMHVTITLHPYNTNDTNYHFNHFSVRGIEESECKQFSFDAASNARLGSNYDCIALEPDLIFTDIVFGSSGANLYEFPDFQNAFDFRGRYVTGAKVSGWVRFWAPAKSGSKMLSIDPFGIYSGGPGMGDRMYKQGDAVYLSYD